MCCTNTSQASKWAYCFDLPHFAFWKWDTSQETPGLLQPFTSKQSLMKNNAAARRPSISSNHIYQVYCLPTGQMGWAPPPQSCSGAGVCTSCGHTLVDESPTCRLQLNGKLYWQKYLGLGNILCCLNPESRKSVTDVGGPLWHKLIYGCHKQLLCGPPEIGGSQPLGLILS